MYEKFKYRHAKIDVGRRVDLDNYLEIDILQPKLLRAVQRSDLKKPMRMQNSSRFTDASALRLQNVTSDQGQTALFKDEDYVWLA